MSAVRTSPLTSATAPAVGRPGGSDAVLLVVALTAVSTSGPLIAATAVPALAIAFWRNAMAGAVLVPTLPRVLPMVATWWEELDHNTASPPRDPICSDLPRVPRVRPTPPTEETRHLDEAHVGLGRAYTDRDLSALLADLERDRASYGESAYSEEREALMLQALGCQAHGSWWAKRRLVRDGKAFLEKHPKSPYAEAVQGMLERVR